jgi:chemotaxis protein MotB
MIQSPDAQPIIIVKKKVSHRGHHGGAWKVAYADFVTAMMALFIVLWLMNSNEQVKQAVAGYFRDPSGKGAETGTGQAGTGDGIAVGKDDMGKLKEKLEGAMRELPQLAKIQNQVQMTVTGEGLRVELMESELGTFFERGNASPSGQGKEMLALLAAELGKLPNQLLIEGHTDSRPFSGEGTYSNWELSSDRANSARRLMQGTGVRADQISEVRGYADQRLRNPKEPENASNRRISVIVRYRDMPPGTTGGSAKQAVAKQSH